ncbi:MAG: hypothetical protein H7098_13275 [Oligoflexus sp.]|nr:hypothetical protein [Pseudopedobacter sp.]
MLDKFLSLFQVIAIEPEKDEIMGKAFSLIPNHFFEAEIDEEAFMSEFTEAVNESINSPEVQRESRLDFHPLPSSSEPYNENQKAFLEKLEEPDRSLHAQLFRIGNVTMRYINMFATIKYE